MPAFFLKINSTLVDPEWIFEIKTHHDGCIELRYEEHRSTVFLPSWFKGRLEMTEKELREAYKKSEKLAESIACLILEAKEEYHALYDYFDDMSIVDITKLETKLLEIFHGGNDKTEGD